MIVALLEQETGVAEMLCALIDRVFPETSGGPS